MIPIIPILLFSDPTVARQEVSPAVSLFAELKVSVVCDFLPPQPQIPVGSQGKSSEQVLQEFARLNGKSIEKLDGLFLLRNKNPHIIADSFASEKTRILVPFKRFPLVKLGDLSTPAKLVSLSATSLTLGRLSEMLRDEARWDVQVSPSLKDSKISLYVNQVSTGNLLQAIGEISHAGPRVILEKSSAQKAMEEDAADRSPEQWKQRKRVSDALREKLEKLLTPEQKERNLAGECIRIGLTEMSPELRAKALEYIQLSARLTPAFDTDLDMSAVSQFGIRFYPPTAGVDWKRLGVHVIGMDGYETFM